MAKRKTGTVKSVKVATVKVATRGARKAAAGRELKEIGVETLAAVRELVVGCGKDVARHARHEWLHAVAIVRLVGRTNVRIAEVSRDGLVACGSLLRGKLGELGTAGRELLARA